MTLQSGQDELDVAKLSNEQVANHLRMLEERVFQTETRWPHFRLLLNDLKRFATELPPTTKVVSLERTLLYGGNSLFAPLFHRQQFVSVDCSPALSDKCDAYNAPMLDDPRTIRIRYSRRGAETETGLSDGYADFVIVPNLVHHVADQDHLFREIARITRPDGQVYIFEPLLRELHQMPADYLRYTPFGLRRVMTGAGLEVESIALEGGPFSAVAYCWDQALQYFPVDMRGQMQRWFYTEEFPRLMKWDEEYRSNLVRKATSFPMAFAVVARKI